MNCGERARVATLLALAKLSPPFRLKIPRLPARVRDEIVGVAGGNLLRGRMRRKTVLGVPVPRSLGKAGLSDLDVKLLAKAVREASKSLGETSKSVSKDIERVGDQAERIGKLLG